MEYIQADWGLAERMTFARYCSDNVKYAQKLWYYVKGQRFNSALGLTKEHVVELGKVVSLAEDYGSRTPIRYLAVVLGNLGCA